MEVSNYTTRIISKSYNIHFMKGEQSSRTFAAAAKVKKDVSDCVLPEIDMSRNSYYDAVLKGEVFYADTVYNIDIKNAYPSILYNNGYISTATYEYINKLDKEEKLAALGMLASRKEIFHHNRSGDIVRIEERVNPLSNFFFFCVQKTEHIIQSCKNQILMESFLFSWVDGIYYINHNENYRSITQMHLKKDFNLESSFQVLTEFEVQLKKDHYSITFKDEKGNKKLFNIPLPESNLKIRIIGHLMSKPYDKEVSLIKIKKQKSK